VHACVRVVFQASCIDVFDICFISFGDPGSCHMMGKRAPKCKPKSGKTRTRRQVQTLRKQQEGDISEQKKEARNHAPTSVSERAAVVWNRRVEGQDGWGFEYRNITNVETTTLILVKCLFLLNQPTTHLPILFWAGEASINKWEGEAWEEWHKKCCYRKKTDVRNFDNAKVERAKAAARDIHQERAQLSSDSDQ
jgi:hypothetical protein